jgi:succinoglycan biosynthesis protein ExoL
MEAPTHATPRQGPAPAGRPRVGFFGHDATESTVIKRARALAAAGIEVRGFTFRREKFNRDYVPQWANTALGTTVDRHYGRRLLALIRALPALARARDELASLDFLYARNLDMAALALVARELGRSRAPLVYEVLDVQRVFLKSGPLGFLFRLAERLILARTQLLTVSSRTFMTRYFAPVQGYAGPWFLLENKVFGLSEADRRRRPTPECPGGPPCPPHGPWVIAWLGNLRCPRSPLLLCRIAEALGERVRIHVHGYPTETGLERFRQAIAGHDNIHYFGEYRSPDDLQGIYDRAHLAWAFDFLDHGTNSAWLLPNRLYEGCFFGAPALALAGTETGRRVGELGLGWTVAEPVDEAVIALLRGLEESTYLERRCRLLALPTALFADEGDMEALCRRILEPDSGGDEIFTRYRRVMARARP